MQPRSALSPVLITLALAGCGSPSGDDTGDDAPPVPTRFQVALTAAPGSTGDQRVNFAIPLPPGTLTDDTAIAIAAGGSELPAARRGLARHADGSWRSIQVQVDVDPASTPALDVELGVPGASGPALVPVEDTLVVADGTEGPRVWALLPPDVFAASGVVGPIVPHARIAGTPLDAWGTVCDYARWDTTAFLAEAATRDVWLFDRATAMYRGHAITGLAGPLASAYREAAIYRAGVAITGGVATGIAVPGAADDLKYHYAQGMAIHYLLTGDDRFREAAEAIAARADDLWEPGYAGGDDFWTERHAGFGLLAFEWAAIVSDDRGPELAAIADAAVDAYLAIQTTYPPSYADADARCFAHSATAHGEGYGTDGCSPWMSAILADGLDAHARRAGGDRAATVRASLARLGRIVARDGRDPDGRPYYWLGVGAEADVVDDYDEHWGESAYIVAMAWDADGRGDDALRAAADELVTGLRERGEAGQLRSFNWQCRSAVMTPAFLVP